MSRKVVDLVDPVHNRTQDVADLCVLVDNHECVRDVFVAQVDDTGADAGVKARPDRVHDHVHGSRNARCWLDAVDALFKTEGGAWLTEAEAMAGVSDITDYKELKSAREEIGDAGLSEDNVRLQVSKEEVAALKGPVHVLVVVPEGAARDVTAATTPLTAEQTKMVVNEVLEERDRKRSEYSISTCPRSKETLLKQQLGLEYSAVSVNEVVDDSIRGYQWSELTEKHPDQRKAYMEYVEEHLRDAFISPKDFLKDVAGKRNLLDCDDQRRLPFKVKGTADMMIIDELANRMDDVFAGLRFVIEVKNDRPSYNERWQLLLELVVADLKSEGRVVLLWVCSLT